LETELANRTIQRLIDGEDPLTVSEQQLNANLAGRVFQKLFRSFMPLNNPGRFMSSSIAYISRKDPQLQIGRERG
jgi:hypothetical protein